MLKAIWSKIVRWSQNETSSAIRLVIDIVSILLMLGSLVSYVASKHHLKITLIVAASGLVVFILAQIIYARIDRLKMELLDCHAFETQLISSLKNAMNLIKPVVVIKELKTYWTVEKNGDLNYFDVIEFTNGGPGKPPIIWFAWEISGDQDAPSIRHIRKLRPYANNVSPPGLALGFSTQKLNDRAFIMHFFFPEPVTEPRQIKVGYVWPDHFKRFLKSGHDEVAFHYEPSPYTIEKLSLTVRFHKSLGQCFCNRDPGDGNMRNAQETADVDDDYNTWTWAIEPPTMGTNYTMQIERR